MPYTTSSDGTRIAYDVTGDGPPLILVGGALSDRKFSKMVQLAELLADRFTVVNYDRRGRGDSGDTPPFSIEREIEDLAAVIAAVGGRASAWGWSSGAVLIARAAAAGAPIDTMVLYEPPFLVDDSREAPPADMLAQLQQLVDDDRRSDALKLLFRTGMGMPAAFVRVMRLLPIWRRLRRVAHTVPYDWALIAEESHGRPLDPADWAAATAPALVLAGAKSTAQLRNAAMAFGGVLPNATHRELAGQSHNPSMKVMAPVVAEYLGSQAAPRPAPVV